MKEERILNALGQVDDKYIKEADPAKKFPKRTDFRKWGSLAACLALIVAVCFSMFSPNGSMVVSAYAYGTDEEITAAGAIMSTGTISDNGEITGHPLMFFLTGEDISTVRYSCKNQRINFVDLTEKRDEFGNAQNFTVDYGENENEYHFLLIEWAPTATVRELANIENSSISTLPDELRQDIIVMEITFANGKTETKAITISLQEDGTFFVSFDNYKITDKDTFVDRPDSETIPRDVLYKDEVEVSVVFRDKELNEVLPVALWYNFDGIDNILVQWTGAAPVTVQMYYTPMGTETIEQKEMIQIKAPLDGENQVVFSAEELNKADLYGHLEIVLDYGNTTVTSETFNVLYDPNMPEYSDEPEPEDNISLVFKLAREYYEERGFTVELLALEDMTDTISPEMDAVVSAQLSKDGEESTDELKLQLRNGTWKIVDDSPIQ